MAGSTRPYAYQSWRAVVGTWGAGIILLLIAMTTLGDIMATNRKQANITILVEWIWYFDQRQGAVVGSLDGADAERERHCDGGGDDALERPRARLVGEGRLFVRHLDYLPASVRRSRWRDVQRQTFSRRSLSSDAAGRSRRASDRGEANGARASREVEHCSLVLCARESEASRAREF